MPMLDMFYQKFLWGAVDWESETAHYVYPVLWLGYP